MFKKLLYSSLVTSSFISLQYFLDPYESVLDKTIKLFIGQYRDYIYLKHSTLQKSTFHHLTFPPFHFKIHSHQFIHPGVLIKESVDPEIEEAGDVHIQDNYQNGKTQNHSHSSCSSSSAVDSCSL
jgi:hypothetical protein